ncbi:MAG: 5'-nucleotidase C-terminal domain-containing protein [Treponema sp.]|nr:5'-nucleotidase C-terminal domain-containing protein [Treponema sp.]
MKKHFNKLFAAVFAVAFLLAGCASTGGNTDKEYTLVVLHTNDHHGSVLTRTDSDGVGHGGLAARATFIKQVRARAAANGNPVLLLDAGDINTGMAVSNMFHAEPDIVAYNAMEYDAVTFGNHEFDGTLAKLQTQIKLSKFTWLGSNVKFKDTGKYLGESYIIKEYEGFTVGIFGLTTLRTKVIASPDKSLELLDEIETAKEMVGFLKNTKNVDIIIQLGHLGDIEETADQQTSIKLAQEVPEIDLIIDGHSHSYFEKPLVVNGTPIISANEWGKYVGEGTLTIKNGKVVNFDWHAVEITDKAFPPDAAMTALLKPYVDESEAELKRVVMKTTAEFTFGNKLPRYQEMASGDFLCDATVAYVKSTGVDVDFAIQNGGGIRTSLPEGDVTKEAIVTMLPFENYIHVLTVSGSKVKELFDFIPTLNQGAGGFPQVSKEVRYTLTYDSDGRNGKISDITIGGNPIDENRTYRIATNDYMAGGGDGYVALTNPIETYNTSMLLSDVFIEYVRNLPQPVTPTTDGRITVIGGVHP